MSSVLPGTPRYRRSIKRSSDAPRRPSTSSLDTGSVLSVRAQRHWRPQVMTELEAVFRVPVIEAYGMTEAAHQIASNPLPPANRVPGSVGVATGCEVAIMDEHGTLLPADQPGEVAIRGSNVTDGYENNLL